MPASLFPNVIIMVIATLVGVFGLLTRAIDIAFAYELLLRNWQSLHQRDSIGCIFCGFSSIDST